jgi:hypothetical protein
LCAYLPVYAILCDCVSVCAQPADLLIALCSLVSTSESSFVPTLAVPAELKERALEGRMQDAVLKSGRATDDAEAVRNKLKQQHATVLALTKKLDTITARSQRLARAYQRTRQLSVDRSNSSRRPSTELQADSVELPGSLLLGP